MFCAHISGLPTGDMRITLLPTSMMISRRLASMASVACAANSVRLRAKLPD
ncbi:hypothetical protein D3C78_1539790 [compost metagenome]